MEEEDFLESTSLLKNKDAKLRYSFYDSLEKSNLSITPTSSSIGRIDRFTRPDEYMVDEVTPPS
jgi:hypothetical protein